ncbi:hypothetical protein BD626DRAFT_453393 [Schizophyllum amplum]|uniref:DUF202 domain-containing protein n=1 Tax=Schizophyllum amplum TaxID=97359 RepID=A0A550CMX0_9AGAR|nr:hypothetical protein BD626DRAFT_453393 [Auriculariopsis ampla]
MSVRSIVKGSSPHPHHTYRGHRSYSFTASDVNELVELRARQRTFHGAYSRSALGSLGYSLTILRLFDHRFYKIGLLFAVFGVLMFCLSFYRSKHSKHDFADHDYNKYAGQTIETKGQHGKRVFGRPFVTAGRVVVAVSVLVLAVEITLMVLVLQV